MKNGITFTPVTESGDREFVFKRPGIHMVYLHNVSGNFRFRISGERVELHIFGLYFGRGGDSFVLDTQQLHEAPSSSSDLLVKGVFDGSSRFMYKGLIRIEPEGNGSHAYQKNQNILLSDKAFISSKPDLEILARDVFCTHGSTTGRPNPNQKFYLASRGLSDKEATGLMVAGFMQDLFSRMSRMGYGREAARYQTLALTSYA